MKLIMWEVKSCEECPFYNCRGCHTHAEFACDHPDVQWEWFEPERGKIYPNCPLHDVEPGTCEK